MATTAQDIEILPVQDEKNLVIQEANEKAPETIDPQWKHVVVDAIDAELDERSMSVRQAFKLYPKAILWSFAMSLVLIMEGFDTTLDGVTGLPIFRRDYGVWAGEENGWQLLPVWQAAIGYGSTIGSFVGIFLSSWFQDKYGYRHCIQVSMVLFTAFHFTLMFAPNIETFFVGKILVGLPWGAFSSSAVSYSAEVTPVTLRAYLTTYNNLCWVIGQFIANGVLRGTQKLDDKWSYKIPLAIQYIWCIPLFLVATFAPESPWWLVKRGRIEEAEKAVKQLQSKNDANDPAKTVALMVRTDQMEVDHSVGSTFIDCFKGVNLRRTEIACMAWSAQVLCGAWFGGGSAYFFQQAGLSTQTSFSFSLGGSAMGIAGTIVSWITITYVGRRKVFLWGLVWLCLLLMLIGFLAIPARHGNTGAPWGQAVITMLWTFAYDFTVGPVAYAIAAEIPSARLRGKTVGLARNAYNNWGVVAGVIQPYMLNPLAWNLAGYQGFFWGVTCFFCLVWAFFRLPETKGRTFRELDILFEKKVSARKFAGTQVSLETEEITAA